MTYKPTKSKTTAVVLAVLFGTFGWLYTYKYDAWKFWLNLTFSIFTFGLWGIVGFIWAIIDQATKPREFYTDYFKQ